MSSGRQKGGDRRGKGKGGSNVLQMKQGVTRGTFEDNAERTARINMYTVINSEAEDNRDRDAPILP
jgi:hypothetical protein